MCCSVAACVAACVAAKHVTRKIRQVCSSMRAGRFTFRDVHLFICMWHVAHRIRLMFVYVCRHV